MTPEPIRFYFDFISPYAWLGWLRIGPLAAEFGRELRPVPVLFAGLLDAHGQLGPAEIPAKRRYVFRDVWRKAHRLGVAISPPPAHPFNPLAALRAVTQLEGEPRRRAIDACFRAVWGGGPGIATPEAVAEVLGDVGLDGPGLVAGGRDPAVKARVKQQTADAISDGIFGVPSMVADGELFWGTDSLVDLRAHLAGAPGPPAALDHMWRELEPAAVRPGRLGPGRQT